MIKKTNKPKRKKRKHYKTGVHISNKCSNGPINYRSGWELTVCKFLDDQDDVVSYSYEPFQIQYIANIRTGKKRNYTPDFFVLYLSGEQKLVEVKRSSQLTNRKVLKKEEVAQKWAKENNTTYQFWTEKMILPLQKIYGPFPEPKKKKPRKKKIAKK